MARFSRERQFSKGRESSSRSRGRRSFDDEDREFSPKREFGGRRDSGRGRSSFGRGGRDKLEMTEVTCDSCGKRCEVPFKPTSSKPVFCKECFDKKDKGVSKENSSRDLDIINEKLNKIMKHLKID